MSWLWETQHLLEQSPLCPQLCFREASMHTVLMGGIQASYSPLVSPSNLPTSQGGQSPQNMTPGLWHPICAKQRHYFVHKGPSILGYVFSVVMYGCESWTIKKAECRIIDAFELWCWTRLLRVPWTARRSNQSILKEISPGCLLIGLMLKLKLQYFGHLM